VWVAARRRVHLDFVEAEIGRAARHLISHGHAQKAHTIAWKNAWTDEGGCFLECAVAISNRFESLVPPAASRPGPRLDVAYVERAAPVHRGTERDSFTFAQQVRLPLLNPVCTKSR
jgi:hypothetical protein